MSKITKSDRTKATILDAAWDLISREGSAVGMADIAKAAGITRQAVYTHFGTRAALLVALVRRADERFEIWQDFDQAMTGPDPRTRLEGCLDAWFRFVPKIHPVATDLIASRLTDPDAARAWHDRMDELKAFYGKLAGGLKKDGALAPGWTAKRAADFIWANSSVQCWALLVTECGWRPADASRQLKRTIVATLIRDEEREAA